jgi:hypothetical protein
MLILGFISCFICVHVSPPSAGGVWNGATCEIEDDGTSEGLGPFEVTAMALSATTIYYPVGIEASSCTFPVIGWGNGMGTTGGTGYPEYFNQMASHGFVVAASHSGAVTGDLILASVQDALNESSNPSSPLYQKLDAAFGVMGKSFGAIAAAEAVQSSPDAIAAVMIAGALTGVSDPGLFVTGTIDHMRMNVSNGYNAASGTAIYAEEDGAHHMDLSHSWDVAELSASFMRCYLSGDTNACNYVACFDCQIGNWAVYQTKGTCPSNSLEHCSDGLDNDCDGDIDCLDSDCSLDPACPPVHQASSIPVDLASALEVGRSKVLNYLAFYLVVPLGAVIFLKILRRRK